jgi:hypothetical protein
MYRFYNQTNIGAYEISLTNKSIILKALTPNEALYPDIQKKCPLHNQEIFYYQIPGSWLMVLFA